MPGSPCPQRGTGQWRRGACHLGECQWGQAILLRLCERIEAEQPADLTALYVLTHAATEEFSLLEAEFDAAGSETGAYR
ncbi:hypothetical protein F0344_00590 [Streptomyces finlayi]|uniref:Uncharacterized protein n=1 Tax=Streptomyces finlayi TaxID=67296 RepID=A0A7G7BDA4_9ACTN|nr:hypothetical protein F0344_00590 [Streptomyces finlayi]